MSSKGLNKFLAQSGLCSRRRAQSLVLNGRVTVNGELCESPASRIGVDDRVEVDGVKVRPQRDDEVRLWLYHKPRGLISTHRDPQNRRTLFETLPTGMPRVNSVGRLDMDSEGLMLLTNSSALERRLELPSSSFVRRYRAELNTGNRGVTSEV
jgi:23S rRNA pseudouridine2605 synthase